MTSPNKSSNFSSRFNQIAQKQQSPETLGQFLKRNVAQNVARAGETILGLPGNLKSAFEESIEKVAPGQLQLLRETEGEAFGQPKEGSLQETLMNPPTVQEVRENITPRFAEALTGEKNYLEPRGKGEEFTGGLTQDVTSFFIDPASKFSKFAKFAIPIAGNLVKEGVKFFGGKEGLAEKSKLGTMLAFSLANQANPGKFASKTIGEAKQMIPDNATINANDLLNKLAPIEQKLKTVGLKVPSKSKTLQGIADLKKQVQNNRLNLKSVMQSRDDINEWIAEAGGFEVPAAIRDRTVKNLNEVKSQIIDTIDDTLQTRFPQAAEMYKQGYQAAAVNHKSQAISNYLEKNFGRKLTSVGAKLLFPAIGGAATLLPKTAAVGAVAAPMYKVGQVLYRINKSPLLAKHYSDVIKNAEKGNRIATINSLVKLDKELAKEEKKKEYGSEQILEDFKSKFMKKD